MEPGTGKRPVAVRGAGRQAQSGGGLIQSQPGEVTQLDQIGFHRIALGQAIKRLVQSEYVLGQRRGDQALAVQLGPSRLRLVRPLRAAILGRTVVPGP